MTELKFKNFNAGKRYYWYTLTGGTDGGEFSRKVYVNEAGPSGVSGGPDNYENIKQAFDKLQTSCMEIGKSMSQGSTSSGAQQEQTQQNNQENKDEKKN